MACGCGDIYVSMVWSLKAPWSQERSKSLFLFVLFVLVVLLLPHLRAPQLGQSGYKQLHELKEWKPATIFSSFPGPSGWCPKPLDSCTFID